MRKEFVDLTNQEQADLMQEVLRFRYFGSACLLASAANADRSSKGWPTLNLESSDDVEINLCEVLDLIHEYATFEVTTDMTNAPLGMLMLLGPDIPAAIIHQAMHDAFCFGVAAVSMLELDFSGAEDFMDKLRGEDNE